MCLSSSAEIFALQPSASLSQAVQLPYPMTFTGYASASRQCDGEAEYLRLTARLDG